MSTKQSRKTAKRKAAQVARRERGRLIEAAMGRRNGPSSQEAAERMSTEQLRMITKLHAAMRDGPRRMMVMDSPMIGMALAEAMLRGMEARDREPLMRIVLVDPFQQGEGCASDDVARVANMEVTTR